MYVYVCVHMCIYVYIRVYNCICIRASLPERPAKKAERRTNLWMLTLLELQTKGYNNWIIMIITAKHEQTQLFEPLFNRLYVC